MHAPAAPQSLVPGGLVWVEKEIPVKPKTACNCPDVWDHLYAAVRGASRTRSRSSRRGR
jgi:hypothetical protein